MALRKSNIALALSIEISTDLSTVLYSTCFFLPNQVRLMIYFSGFELSYIRECGFCIEHL